jgi:Domain of unknown function (DUF3331)
LTSIVCEVRTRHWTERARAPIQCFVVPESEMAKSTYVLPTITAPRSARAEKGGNRCLGGRFHSDTPANDEDLRWRHITKLLLAYGGGGDAAACTRHPLRASSGLSLDGCNGRNATIEILDRPSPASAVLSWRDPTGGSYGYQLWRKQISKETGSCALTGCPICRGDVIFKPTTAKGVRHANASAMILAVYIERPLN